MKKNFYPDMPPALKGESNDAYTDRLTGADQKKNRPYNHRRNRQCSIGYHDECTDPAGETCECPCHEPKEIARQKKEDEAELQSTLRDLIKASRAYLNQNTVTNRGKLRRLIDSAVELTEE